MVIKQPAALTDTVYELMKRPLAARLDIVDPPRSPGVGPPATALRRTGGYPAWPSRGARSRSVASSSSPAVRGDDTSDRPYRKGRRARSSPSASCGATPGAVRPSRRRRCAGRSIASAVGSAVGAVAPCAACLSRTSTGRCGRAARARRRAAAAPSAPARPPIVVVVVGAGAGRPSCARVLQRRGATALLLRERRSRPRSGPRRCRSSARSPTRWCSSGPGRT